MAKTERYEVESFVLAPVLPPIRQRGPFGSGAGGCRAGGRKGRNMLRPGGLCAACREATPAPETGGISATRAPALVRGGRNRGEGTPMRRRP